MVSRKNALLGSCDNSMRMSNLSYKTKSNFGFALIRNQKGMADIMIIGYVVIFIFSILINILAVEFVSRQKSVATHMWFGEAMNFAAQAANLDGDIHMVALNEAKAEEFFRYAFSSMVDGTVMGNVIEPGNKKYFPGTIELSSFETISPGDSVPGGIANQPGYLAKIRIPVFKGKIPQIGEKTLYIPLEYFAVVSSSENEDI